MTYARSLHEARENLGQHRWPESAYESRCCTKEDILHGLAWQWADTEEEPRCLDCNVELDVAMHNFIKCER